MINISGKKVSPFFIFGCPRSGTSLLSRILNHHDQMGVPYESHLFNTFYPLLAGYGDLSKRTHQKQLIRDILSTDVMGDWRPKLQEEKVLANLSGDDFGAIVEAVIGSWVKTQGKTRWGEKTPYHLYYRNEIFKYFPQAKVIHIVRDGRDVAMSLKQARFGPKTIYKGAELWVRYLAEFERMKKERSPECYQEIRYEDLLSSPEQIIRGVCDFLGEHFRKSMLLFYQNIHDYSTDEANRHNLKKPLLKDNMYKWRSFMVKKDIQLVESIAAKALTSYGYPLSGAPLKKLSRLETRFYSTFHHLPPKIGAMLANRKGHRDWYIRFRVTARLKLVMYYHILMRIITGDLTRQ